MLNPEVWDFKAPESKFSSAVGDLSQENTLPQKINTFYYNHLISVITPGGVEEFPKEVLLDDSDYYKLTDLPVEEFVNRDFIGNFIKKGQLTALTINTRIDCDNCICITPSGKLILSLTKESYQGLGLQGKESHYTKTNKKNNTRYIVTVNLLGGQLVANKKNIDVPKCLKKLGCFTFIAIWEPQSEDVCPSSLAKYFNDLGYDVAVCKNSHFIHPQTNISVPIVQYEDPADVQDVVEWLGIVTLQCPDTYSDTYLSGYSTPTPCVKVNSIFTRQYRGFFTPTRIVKFIDAIRKIYKNKWFSIYVQGFSDSPVNWKDNEHHYFTNGDNCYIFLFNRYKYMFATNETSNKRYK